MRVRSKYSLNSLIPIHIPQPMYCLEPKVKLIVIDCDSPVWLSSLPSPDFTNQLHWATMDYRGPLVFYRWKGGNIFIRTRNHPCSKSTSNLIYIRIKSQFDFWFKSKIFLPCHREGCVRCKKTFPPSAHSGQTPGRAHWQTPRFALSFPNGSVFAICYSISM